MEQKQNEEVKIYLEMRRSLIFFMERVWGLSPQKVKLEYQQQFNEGLKKKDKDWDKFCTTVTKEWFEEYIPNKQITWQQSLVAYGIGKIIKKECSPRVSIVSGHGIGKSTISSMIILWFLFGRPECQVACTSPTQDQLFDVLFKELKKWIDRMPANISSMYIWEKSHIRMKESPETWFARAKTASKENTEALAGVHADWVLMLCDEASGVDEAIFETMEGALTSGNILVFLVSNGTRANGYFYDTHHKDKERWQNYKFSSLDSPRVDKKYVQSIIDKYGEDSIQYAIRVKGEFPKEDGMDDSGYIPLLQDKNIITRPDEGQRLRFASNSVLGVDPAGDGDDKTSWVIRDNFKAKKLYEENKSTAKSIAERTLTFMNEYNIRPRNVVVDAFGVGADVGKEIAIASKGQVNVTTVNTGDKCELDKDKDIYLNKRAMCFYEAKKWLQQGGELIENGNFKEELLGIRYKRNLSGLIQIMPKIDMKKKYGLKSPNDADAFSLTFLRSIPKQMDEYMENKQREIDDSDFDQFAVI
jgi:hypothetical protein